MTSSTRGRDGSGSPDPGDSPLAEALEQNREATAEVKKAADELAVVHAVLDTHLRRGADEADVKKAVAETDSVERRLTASAEKLERVNDTLERESHRAA